MTDQYITDQAARVRAARDRHDYQAVAAITSETVREAAGSPAENLNTLGREIGRQDGRST